MIISSKVKELLQKYRCNTIPPLTDEEDAKKGLINGELLKIYHHGVRNDMSSPLGYLLADMDFDPDKKKWEKGNNYQNEWGKNDWSDFCDEIRKTEIGNLICDKCDRKWACIAEEKREAIAYICDCGLIDFAVPIYVKEKVTAIIYCGQFKPKTTDNWSNSGILWEDAGNIIRTSDSMTNIWESICINRIDNIAKAIGIEQKLLYSALDESKANIVREISSYEINNHLERLNKISGQISTLATIRFELEKGKVIDWINNEINLSLSELRSTICNKTEVDIKKVWSFLKKGFENICQYYGLDYLAIVKLAKNEYHKLIVLANHGINYNLTEFRINQDHYSKLLFILKDSDNPLSLDLREYKNIDFFKELYKHHKKSTEALIFPLKTHVDNKDVFLLAGKFKSNLNLEEYSNDDKEAFIRIKESITLVIDVILLIEQLQYNAQMQSVFIEELAHDIRTPIQNIIFESEILRRRSQISDDAMNRINSISSQVRRLHNVSQRVWTLTRLETETLDPSTDEYFSVFHILNEHKKFFEDEANRRQINIDINPNLQSLPSIKTYKGLCSQAILNLIDNAVKYSRDKSVIKIYGKEVTEGVSISIENLGIPIEEVYFKKIFERRFRTPNAQQFSIGGAGIGLSIVKAFMDYCGGEIKVKSFPIGSRFYLTEFKMVIPERRM